MLTNIPISVGVCRSAYVIRAAGQVAQVRVCPSACIPDLCATFSGHARESPDSRFGTLALTAPYIASVLPARSPSLATLAVVALRAGLQSAATIAATVRQRFANVTEVDCFADSPSSVASSCPNGSVQCLILCAEEAGPRVTERLGDLRENYPSACLVLVANNPTRDAAREALRAGADDCLSDDDPEWVCERVGVLLRGRSAVFPVARYDLELEEDDLAVRLPGGETRLTKTEFRIVHHLWLHHEQWISHEEIMRDVLRMRNTHDTALVRVHLSNIRRKLGSAAELLTTRRQQGTRLSRTFESARRLRSVP